MEAHQGKSMPSLPKKIITSLLRISLVFLVLFAGLLAYLAQPSWGPSPASPLTVDPERIRSHVTALSESFHPRNSDRPDNLNRTADYVREHFASAGATVEEQAFKINGQVYRNIIGHFGVGKPQKYVIGAHYDAYDGTPGADDNASGVAGLIELGYLLGRDGTEREIELVAWVLEEPPYFSGEEMGSAVHARSLQGTATKIAGAISLEMIGYYSDEMWSQRYPVPFFYLHYPARGNFIAVIGRREDSPLIKSLKTGMQGRTPLPVYSMAAPAGLSGVDLSDHRNYWRLGVPAVMVTDTAFMRNMEYHGNDTANRLDYQRIAQVIIAVYEAIRTLQE